MRLSDVLSLWPRAGVEYHNVSASSVNGSVSPSVDQFAIDAEVMLVISPWNHFGFTVGPTIDIWRVGGDAGPLLTEAGLCEEPEAASAGSAGHDQASADSGVGAKVQTIRREGLLLQGVPSPFHVHLVATSNEDSTYIKPLWVATLAAHTPDDVELTFRDDGLDPIDLAREGDAPNLVGISVNSKTAARAYSIADAYRGRGSVVVLGGIHVTALPDEAALHADAVVSGEAEWVWQDVVRGARSGKLGRARCLIGRALYQHDEYMPLVGLPKPRRDLVKSTATSPLTSSRPRAAARSRASFAVFRHTTGPSFASDQCRR